MSWDDLTEEEKIKEYWYFIWHAPLPDEAAWPSYDDAVYGLAKAMVFLYREDPKLFDLKKEAEIDQEKGYVFEMMENRKLADALAKKYPEDENCYFYGISSFQWSCAINRARFVLGLRSVQEIAEIHGIG